VLPPAVLRGQKRPRITSMLSGQHFWRRAKMVKTRRNVANRCCWCGPITFGTIEEIVKFDGQRHS